MVILTIVMAIGEGISPQAMATITAMAIVGPHPADAASWGEVQAQRFVEVSSPRDSKSIAIQRLVQGDFIHWCPPKKLKYVKPRLGESTLT